MTQDTTVRTQGQHTDRRSVTGEQMLTTLIDLACQRPDYVDPRARSDAREGACAYTVRGQPACIIGHQLARLELVMPEDDFMYDEFAAAEEQHVDHPEEVSISHKLVAFFHPDVDLPPAQALVWDVLAAVQSSQDQGNPWGVAVAHGLQTWSIAVPERLTRALETGSTQPGGTE